MISITFALFFFTALQGFALTFNSDGLLDAPDAVMEGESPCDDCTKILNLLVDLLSNADLQKKITEGLGNLCDHLPGKASMIEFCKEEVDKILPVAISFLTVVAKPQDICRIIGLCSSNDKQEMLSYSVNEALQAAMTGDNGKPTSPCAFCIFFVKTLDDLLPKERTEEAVVKLMEDICHILPASYRSQCEVFIGRFSKTVMDAILSYATPRAICTLIHLCQNQEGPLIDPCTLTTYRCRDLQTSLKCGTLFYCQKFAWKPLSYNTV
ncbi:prosaposin [Dunckerocampus dactyliophorus]|uniref:prosaposin n=1 Tax=Dunckerocampus dactyliophorus TaxID=161453 RepID=UPI0024051E97|nr:prosaposin [Dunckerocampus dactyliophorus]